VSVELSCSDGELIAGGTKRIALFVLPLKVSTLEDEPLWCE